MKAMKVEILVLDFDNLGEDGVKDALENTHFANRCISPDVKSIESVDIEWHDRHPLNITQTKEAAYIDLFKGS